MTRTSIQDTDPLNDLKSTDITEKPSPKETDNRVSGSGYIKIIDMASPPSSQTNEDEDDFDFTWVGTITPYEAPTKPSGSALKKEQLLGAGDGGTAAAATKATTVFNAVLAGAPAEAKTKYASYTQAGETITSPFSYAVYKIDVNLDGLVNIHNNDLIDIDPGVLREIVPDGMEIFNFESGGHTYYGIQLWRAYDRYPGIPDKGYIDWGGITDANKYYAETSAQSVIWNEVIPYGTHDNIYGARALTVPAPPTANDPYSFGITSSFADATQGNGGILEFKFGQAAQTAAAYKYNNAAYRLYAVMVPKSISDVSKNFTNQVELTYSEAEPATDSATTLWTNSAGAAALNKSVYSEADSGFISAYNVAMPVNGVLEQKYRLQLPTSSTSDFAAESVKFQDEADGRYFTGIVGSVVVTATQNNSPAPTLMTVKPLLTNGNAPLKGFSAYNSAVVPAGNYLHTFDYTFRYEGVPCGVAVKNTALRTVYTVVPLKLDFAKLDADDDAAVPAAWEFKAYYADQYGQADTDNPVTDAITGNDIVFTPARLSAYLIPGGYQTPPNAARSTDIILVETVPPTGYPSGYEGNEYLLRLNVDAVGTMSVTPVAATSSNGYAAAFDSGAGIASVKVYNKIPEAPTVKIIKQSSAGGTLTGVSFTLANSSGYTETASTDGSGEIEFTLPQAYPDFVGTYTLTEGAPPADHVGLTGGITITVDGEGLITGADAVAADPVGAVGLGTGALALTVTNIQEGSAFLLFKRGVSLTGPALSGATFTLTGESTGWTATETATESGLLTFQPNPGTDLFTGVYTLTEDRTPEGYLPLPGAIRLTFDTNGILTGAVPDDDSVELSLSGPALTVVNVPEPSPQLRIVKRNDNGLYLPNVGFTLSKTDNSWSRELYTDADGQALLALPAYPDFSGGYRLAEVAAPLGHSGLNGPIYLNVGTDGTITLDPSAGDEGLVFSYRDSEMTTVAVTNNYQVPTAEILIRKAISGIAASDQTFGFTLTELNGAESPTTPSRGGLPWPYKGLLLPAPKRRGSESQYLCRPPLKGAGCHFSNLSVSSWSLMYLRICSSLRPTVST